VQPKWDLTRDSGVDDAAIWRKHKEELIRYATILVGADHSEDVLSTVVERILRRHGSLSHLDDARPYLFRAVLNESRAVNYPRRLDDLGSSDQPEDRYFAVCLFQVMAIAWG